MRPTPSPRPCRAAQTIIQLLVLTIAVSVTPRFGAAAEPVETKIWGRSSLLIAYDTADLRAGIDFGSYVTKDGQDRVNFNPRDTRLGLSAAQTKGAWTYKSVFEMDFYGDNAGNNLLPRLRLGFVDVSHSSGFALRAGQDWIPVAQQNPGTLDFGVLAWGGNLWWRVPQVTVRQKTGDFEFLAGMMKHRNSIPQEAEEQMPWFLGRLAWNGLSDGKGLLAISGGGRSNSLTDRVALHNPGADSTRIIYNTDYNAWLLCGEWKLPLGPRLTLNGEVWTGKGIGREFVRYDLDYNRQTRRSLNAKGGFASAAVDLGRGLQANLGGGIDDPADDDLADAKPRPIFRQNMVLFGNLKWQTTEHFGAGFEVMNFTTEAGPDDKLDGQRFTMGTWFVF